jgi:selenocysteine lyase/cysteine desulfurase
MHRALGTLASGGTARLSWGAMNTPEEIDAAVQAIREIAEAMSPAGRS